MFCGINRRLFKAAKLFTALSVAVLLFGAAEAGAYVQDWGDGFFPSIITNNASYSYAYKGTNKLSTFKMTGNANTLFLSDGSYTPIQNGMFTLTAYFYNGVFQPSKKIGTQWYTSTMSITGKAVALPGHDANGNGFYDGYESGTLVKSDKLTFSGFQGSYRAGYLQFMGENKGFPNLNTGDPDFAWMDPHVYVQAFTSNMTNFLGVWDPSNNNNPNFWKRNFSGTATVDTWAPIPGSLLLLGSGLTGLFGLRRRWMAV